MDWLTWLWRLRSLSWPFASWRPRGDGSRVSEGLSIRTNGTTSSSNAGENQCPSSKTGRKEWILSYFSFLLYLHLQLTGWGPLLSSRTICFTQVYSNLIIKVYSILSLIQTYPYRHTQTNVQPNPWALCGSVRLTHKINHQNINTVIQ